MSLNFDVELPSEPQVARCAEVLRHIRVNGNRRPGDAHVDHDIDVQLKARAYDICTVLLNWQAISSRIFED